MNNKISINIVEGIGKQSGKPWKGIKLEIGDWSTLVFPRSRFEFDYIEQVLKAAEK